MDNNILLREVIPSDLPIFFQQQSDPEANFIAAFTSRDPSDWNAFSQHWRKILERPTVIPRTILVEKNVAGYVLSYEEKKGRPEVGYWIGKEFWGKGIATRALSEFLAHANTTRPIHARAAKDNLASLRVLEKNGFIAIGESRGYANARGQDIEEVLLVLKSNWNPIF